MQELVLHESKSAYKLLVWNYFFKGWEGIYLKQTMKMLSKYRGQRDKEYASNGRETPKEASGEILRCM